MAFSPKTALTLAKISELAYSPANEVSERVKELRIRNSKILSGSENIVFLRKENNRADTECYLFLTSRKDIIISFRGSEMFDEDGGFKDWIKTDLDIDSVAYPLDENDPRFFRKKQAICTPWILGSL